MRPRGRGRGVVALGIAVAGLLVAGIASLLVLPPTDQAQLVGPPGPVTSTTVANDAACPAARVAPTSGLLTRLFIAAPNGFTRVPDAQVGAGPLTAAQVAQSSGRAGAAATELRLDGFEGAALRVWVDEDDQEQAQITLIEFSCAAGASEYFNTQVAGSFGVPGGGDFQVAGSDDARGVRTSTPDSKGHYLQEVGVISGTIYEQTATFTPTPDDGSFAGAVSQLQVGSIGAI